MAELLIWSQVLVEWGASHCAHVAMACDALREMMD